MYSNCCCSCSFEAEIIKIGQSSHKMYSNNIMNFQVSTTILNACTKKSGNLLKVSRIFNSMDIYAFLPIYAYKSNISFLRNALMMIIRSFVKIITTHEYIKKNLFGQILSPKNLCYTSPQLYPGDNFNLAARRMYHHTHTQSPIQI